MTELEKLLKSLDPALIKKLQGFATSDEGAKLIKNLSGVKKEDLIAKVTSMSLSDKDALIKKLTSDPSLLSKIKEML